MLILKKNGQFGIASEYDQNVEPIIDAVENVEAPQDVNVFNERDLIRAEYVQLDKSQKELQKKRVAQRNRENKLAYSEAYNDLFRKEVESMNKRGVSQDDSLLSEALVSGQNTEIWTGKLGPSHDYPRVVGRNKWSGEMSGANNGQMGDLWDSISNIAEQTWDEISGQAPGFISDQLYDAAGNLIKPPPTGTTVVYQPAPTNPVPATAPRSFLSSITPDQKKYITYAAVGLGALFTILLVIRMLPKKSHSTLATQANPKRKRV